VRSPSYVSAPPHPFALPRVTLAGASCPGTGHEVLYCMCSLSTIVHEAAMYGSNLPLTKHNSALQGHDYR